MNILSNLWLNLSCNAKVSIESLVVQNSVLLTGNRLGLMQSYYMLGQTTVFLLARIVDHNEKQIKSTKKTIGKIDVLMGTLGSIVLPIDWIGSSQNRASGIESHRHSSLGNRDSLLLHDFV